MQVAAHRVELPFQRLDVYRVGLELVRLSGRVAPARGNADLRDQLRRASSSVVLNVAEACGKSGADRARYFEIARGSACECAAALDVLHALGYLDAQALAAGAELCSRLYGMLHALCRKGR